MRKLLNTLYITTPESYISKDGNNLVVSVKQEEVFRIPAINVEGVITFGYMGASPGAMKLCADSGIALSFLSPNGRFIGRLQGPVQGNVLLRKAQYRFADDVYKSLHISRNIIAAKIQNYRAVLRRHIRDYGANPVLEHATQQLDRFKATALRSHDAQELLGQEGIAANAYFDVFPELILNQKSEFPFAGRNRRPPRDAVNAMLSLAYTLLAHDMTAALDAVGLDPYVGVYHRLRPGRASLALDLIEELRAYLGDRLVLSLINRRQVSPTDFIAQGDDGVVMTDNGRRAFISAWQNRKRETMTHPYLQEKIPVGLIPHVQAMLFARFLRNDLDDYPVFLIK